MDSSPSNPPLPHFLSRCLPLQDFEGPRLKKIELKLKMVWFELWNATWMLCSAMLCRRHILPIRPLNSGHEPTPLKGLLTAFAPYIALFIGAKGVMDLGILASRWLCREANAAPYHRRCQQTSYSCSDKELPVSIRREIKNQQGDMKGEGESESERERVKEDKIYVHTLGEDSQLSTFPNRESRHYLLQPRNKKFKTSY